jgi:hypothetical protein
MLTAMKTILDSHFGMAGTTKNHTLVNVIVIAGFLSIGFDLNRPVRRPNQPRNHP